MRFFGIVICLAALGLTGYSALTFKAPGIQDDIEGRTVQSLTLLQADNVEVRVDGRHVTLEGSVADDQRRQEILEAVSTVPGVLGPIDGLDRMALVSPYRFGAVKDEIGEVAVAGYAPDEEAKAAIIGDAKALFGDDMNITIDVADGAPSDDWQAAAIAALDALATMRQGKFSISDRDILIEGKVAAEADIEAIQFFSEMMPEGYSWTDDLDLVAESNADLAEKNVDTSASDDDTLFADVVGDGEEEKDDIVLNARGEPDLDGSDDALLNLQSGAKPYTFSVAKEANGALHLNGFAPDDAAREALVAEGKAISAGQPVVVDIRIANGVPDDEWLSMVLAGISAMQDMESGRLDVVDNEVSFFRDPNSEAAEQAGSSIALDSVTDDVAEAPVAATATDLSDPDLSVDAAIEPGADEVAVERPALTVDKVEEGVWSMRGRIPDDRSRSQLVTALKEHAGVDDVDVELVFIEGASDEGWTSFADEQIKTLDAVRAGRLVLEDRKVHLIGVVDSPDDIQPVQAKLTAINDDMTVDLQPIDPRPLATLDLKLSADGSVVLNGALPSGLTEAEAMVALGIKRHQGREIAEEGRGAADVWRDDLSIIGEFLPIFEEIDLSLGGNQPRIVGKVNIHAEADTIAQEIVLALGNGRQPLVDVETTSAIHPDGEIRSNPLNGQNEVHRQGYWLPIVDIAADEETCREGSSDTLSTTKITFLRGQGNLDYRTERVLNTLAALALACLDNGNLVLEIGGHTDSRGSTELNRELSQARADAVLNALAARGVNVDAMIAVGYGDQQPIADNGTNDGRAANRRITFEWMTPDKSEDTEAES